MQKNENNCSLFYKLIACIHKHVQLHQSLQYNIIDSACPKIIHFSISLLYHIYLSCLWASTQSEGSLRLERIQHYIVILYLSFMSYDHWIMNTRFAWHYICIIISHMSSSYIDYTKYSLLADWLKFKKVCVTDVNRLTNSVFQTLQELKLRMH